MTETGRIVEINSRGVTVVPEKGAACFGCMNQECRGSGSITAGNPLSLPLKVGQLVEVSVPGISISAQALSSLLPPAAGFTAGYFLARFIFPGAGEGAAAGLGVVFLFAAAFAVYTVRKKYAAPAGYTVTGIAGRASQG